MTQKKDKKAMLAQWLEQLQQESWQLELLISGLALFGVWESQGLVQNLDQQLSGSGAYSGLVGTLLGIGMLILKSGIKIVLVNFLIHVTLRALWIGAIGLRYVSGDIDYNKLKYSARVTRYYQNSIGSFDDYIERLENWCSVIFAYTFLAVGLFISFMLYILWISLALGLIYTLDANMQTTGLFVGGLLILYFGIGLFVFIDFITMGAFRRIKDDTFAAIFLWIYKAFGILTLSIVYRPILLNFLDQRFTRRLFFLSIPYVAFILFVFPPMEIVTYEHFPRNAMDIGINPRNYDDLRAIEESHAIDPNYERSKISYFSLGSSVVEGPYGRVFFAMRSSDSDYLKDEKGIQPFRKGGLRHNIFADGHLTDTLRTAKVKVIESQIDSAATEFRSKRRSGLDYDEANNWYLNVIDSLGGIRNSMRNDYDRQKYSNIRDALKEMISMKIDSVDYKDSLNCKFYIHPNLGEKGLLCFYPTGSLDRGEHVMHIKRNLYDSGKYNDRDHREWWVPFWKN